MRMSPFAIEELTVENDCHYNDPKFCIEQIRKFPISEIEYTKLIKLCESHVLRKQNPSNIWLELSFLVLAGNNDQLPNHLMNYLTKTFDIFIKENIKFVQDEQITTEDEIKYVN